MEETSEEAVILHGQGVSMEGGGLATMDLTDGNRGSKPSGGSISPNLSQHSGGEAAGGGHGGAH